MMTTAAPRCNETLPHIACERASCLAFSGAIVLLFVMSAAITIDTCNAMADGMPMPGGWTMSMTWMRMPQETWWDASAKFLGMWIAMMVAMMLPSVAPVLWRCRQTLARAGRAWPAAMAALAGTAYFFVWTMLGVVVFPIGVALAAVAMQAPALADAMPFAQGAMVVIVGALQFTPWKARRSDWCSPTSSRACASPVDLGSAWRLGVRTGLRCCVCCGNLMTILLVAGIMDLRAMAGVAAAITIERLAPARARAAQAVGVVVVAAGLCLLARAAFSLV